MQIVLIFFKYGIFFCHLGFFPIYFSGFFFSFLFIFPIFQCSFIFYFLYVIVMGFVNHDFIFFVILSPKRKDGAIYSTFS
jgi:hypothetical protein